MQIILASSSPRRKQLLSYLIDDFEVVPSKVDEKKFEKLAKTPEELVIGLARRKAINVDMRYGIRDMGKKEEILIIAADTAVVLGCENKWEIIGKPVDEKDARKILEKLRGKIHKVFTGLCVLQRRTGQTLTDCVISEVAFKNFSNKVMDDYIKSGKPLDKAGAYGIQEIGGKFVEKVEESYSNVMGLPIERLAEILEEVGIEIKISN